MKLQKNAISSVVVVVILVVIVAVAVAAYYLTSAPPPSATTSSSSSSLSMSSPSTTSSSTSAPVNSTSSTASQTSSIVATETLSCTSNTTALETQLMLDFFSAYSSMNFSVQGTRNGATFGLTMSYALVHVSSTTYIANFTYVVNGETIPTTIWVQKNGTVSALYISGKNYTSSQDITKFLVKVLTPISIYHSFGTQATSSSSYFHSTGTSTLTIGTNMFTITNYTSNSPNVAIPSCNGETFALTTYRMSVGTPTGSNFEIIPYMNIGGSDTITTASGTRTNTFDYTIQITALTVA